jgi:hypothetical protein
MLKKFLRYLVLTFAGVLAFVLIFIFISVAPVDRQPASELASTQSTLAALEKLDVVIPEPRSGFSVGFGKSNITPAEPVSLAGYIKRKSRPYLAVHDSIFARAMVVSNGAAKVAIVSADLLIIPPTVTRILPERLAAIGFSLDNTYLSAIHSHNSIGHWGEGATRLIYGAYKDSVVQAIADGIVASIAQADADLVSASIKSGAIPVPQAVKNRLIDGGPEDPYLRVIEVERSDSTKALLATYAAHATCLSSREHQLSRDYPGTLVDLLEQRGYDFAMFLAGAVGSHKGAAPADDWECMTWMANQIADTFFEHRHELTPIADSALVMIRVPLALSDPQVKVTRDWKVRAWLFRSALGEYDVYTTALRLGDRVMLGTPCDFSGEFMPSVDSAARRNNLKPIVTSFNGGYIGYVTPRKYYDIDHYETRVMNWYAPGTGEYIRECLYGLMDAVSDSR